MTIRRHRGDLPDLSRYTGSSVAVDTEAMGLDARRDRLCVVQLSPGDGSADVVQIPAGNISAPNLSKLMGDGKILKIFHNKKEKRKKRERKFESKLRKILSHPSY